MLSLAIAGVLLAGPFSQGTGCDSARTLISACNSSGSQVDISAGRGGQGSPPSADGNSGSSSSRPGADDSDDDSEPEDCGRLGCRGNYVVVTPPDLTIEDLASFRPSRPTLTGEPAGFAVVGMPANLVAGASEQIIPGRVLDWDVRVKFTPVSFEFAHGDGTSSVASTGGTTWARLGQTQFSPTGTSHVYRDRGTFRATVTVRYTAAVDFGRGRWRPVPGQVSANAGGYTIRVVEARTSLVERSCVENPDGPAC